MPGTCKMRLQAARSGTKGKSHSEGLVRGEGEGAVEEGGERSWGQQLETQSVLRRLLVGPVCVCVCVCARAHCISELETGLHHDTGDTDLERPTVCPDDWVRSLTSSHGYYMDLISIPLVEESLHVLCL